MDTRRTLGQLTNCFFALKKIQEGVVGLMVILALAELLVSNGVKIFA